MPTFKFKLNDEDRQRYGSEGALEFDTDRIGLREAALVQRETGYSPDDLSRFDKPKVRNGRPVLRDARDDDGNVIYMPDGVTALKEPDTEPDLEVLAVVIWMAMRRAGVKVPFDDDFEINLIGVDMDLEPGKAQE